MPRESRQIPSRPRSRASDRPPTAHRTNAAGRAKCSQFLEVAPGQRVLDFFAGPGYYSELLARVVGIDGAVLLYNDALYAQAAHHDLIQRLSRKRLPNVKALNEPSNYLKLEPGSLDRVLFVLVYHDLYWRPRDASEQLGDPAKVLAILHAALKPGGLVVVVDHSANPTPRESTTAVASGLHRIDPKTVRSDFERAGFEFAAESTAFRNEQDDRTRSVFDPTIRFRTDQFMYKFRKGLREPQAKQE